jgi:molybdopterin-containing oxidoreductase family membrane subunit
LLLESLPIIASWEWLRNRFPKLADKMSNVHHYAPYLAIAGLFLSSLHQSSLGATYGVLKARPFWYKPEMSVLFMLSAIIGGISMTLFASMLASRLTSRAKINDGLIEKLSHFVGWALVAYFYWRFWDTLSMTYTYEPGRTEGLRLITTGPLAFNFWVGEIILGILIPMILLLNRKTRLNPFWRMIALLLVVGGVVAYRWDINLSGALVVVSYLPGQPTVSYTSYTPSLVEWAIGLGVIAYGLLAFSLGVRYLRVVDHRLTDKEHETVKIKATEPVTV